MNYIMINVDNLRKLFVHFIKRRGLIGIWIKGSFRGFLGIFLVIRMLLLSSKL